MRVGQGIAHDRLEDGAGQSQIRPDQGPRQGPGQADIPDNLIGRPDRRLPEDMDDVNRRNRRNALQDG